jgi:hypothetical protein
MPPWRMSEGLRKSLKTGALTIKWRNFNAWNYRRRVQRIEWLSVFGQDAREKDADVEEDRV